MEIIVGLAVIALVIYVFTRKKDVQEANEAAPAQAEAPVQEQIIALGEPPATVVIPVEGAGAVEVPAEAPAKKPRAKKATTPKAPAKPRAKKAKAE
jgi:hypothetical protein